MNKIKKVFLTILCAFTLLVVIGCGEKANISFEQESINVVVNHEFKLNPVVTGDSKELKYDFDSAAFEVLSDGSFKALVIGNNKIKVSLKNDEKVF